jgi:TetR/AcrR family transcriptional regulator, mexJK operon transcriptional repressor
MPEASKGRMPDIEQPILETGAFRRGPGGRPTRQEAERRHRQLLETTKLLLLERGWDATSIDEISRQSGVAKRFIYARYPDKTSLFIAAVAQFRDEQIGALGAVDATPEDVEEGLLQLGRRMMQLALGAEALSIIRLFLSEAPRIPDFARRFAETFPRRGLSGLSHYMRVYTERGVLSIDDPELAAQHFAMLVIGVPQRLAMLGHRESPEQQERRLRSAVKLFLDGCRRRA